MKRLSSRPIRSRQHGFTLIEILVTIAIIGVIANIIVPAMIHQITKARATHIMSEYKLLEHAVHSYNTDAGSAPRPWFSTREHPDLRPYLKGRIEYRQPGLGLSKFFIRYSDAVPGRALRFRSGYLLYSRRPSPLLQVVQDNFDGKVEVYWPGRLIVLVIESV